MASDITITFNLNGRGEADPVDPLTCAQGHSCDLPSPNPVRGWVFMDWWMDEDGTEPLPSQWVEGGGFDDDTTLYAQWSVGHTVDWNYGGKGSGGPAFTVVLPGSRLWAPTVTPPAGFLAPVWFTSAAFTTEWTFTTPVTSDLELFARWDPVSSPPPTTPPPTSQTPTTPSTSSASATPTKPPPSATAVMPTPGTSSSTGDKGVALKAAKVTVKLAAKKIARKDRGKVTVTVVVPGVAKPTGTLVVKAGKKSVTVALKAAKKGKVTVKLPKLAKGSYGVTATFAPTAASAKAAIKGVSKKVTLRVT